ncbi:uncharacterized protein HaLaN_07325 [Haematococcus lacustris]|uniref:Uncharacterized protein n=1 Tax=Haematococcus lacustris TaxID=44745 RepID=A0A699YYT6_HAELA|nr:uncharacterized protein HaLaN_07325 [Haematococcus lacustris]
MALLVRAELADPPGAGLVGQGSGLGPVEGFRPACSSQVKSETCVKDAAGAIAKVLQRLSSTLVTALHQDDSHQALNKALKALAVSRKYVSDQEPGQEVGFLPLLRSNPWGNLDPHLFAFLAFKVSLVPGVSLKASDATDLNAVMKAGGQAALFVAMTAVVGARRRLKREHAQDIMLMPQWFTEDTTAQLGRQSKFLRLNVLPCGLNGVQGTARQSSVRVTEPQAA